VRRVHAVTPAVPVIAMVWRNRSPRIVKSEARGSVLPIMP
jgi:hypothetical protein